jgi:hypothetical protein
MCWTVGHWCSLSYSDPSPYTWLLVLLSSFLQVFCITKALCQESSRNLVLVGILTNLARDSVTLSCPVIILDLYDL